MRHAAPRGAVPDGRQATLPMGQQQIVFAMCREKLAKQNGGLFQLIRIELDRHCRLEKPDRAGEHAHTRRRFRGLVVLSRPDGGWLGDRGYPFVIWSPGLDSDWRAARGACWYRCGPDTQDPPMLGHDIYIDGDGMVSMFRSENGHIDL